MATRQLYARVDGGRFVELERAKRSIVSHGYNYGFVFFEGERTYLTHDNKTVFLALPQHSRRLIESAKGYDVDVSFSQAQLELWTMQTAQRNGGGNLYVRPQVRLQSPDDDYGIDPGPDAVPMLDIFAKESHAYFSQQTGGLKVMKSDVMKPPSQSMPAWVKISGNYTSSTKAKRKARKYGFDDAMMLNDRGNVAEFTGANMVVQVDSTTFATPDRGSDRLISITNELFKILANRNGFDVKETEVTFEDVLKAKTAAAAGTAVGIAHVGKVGDKLIGNGLPTPQLKKVIRSYSELTVGLIPDLSPTYLREVPPPEIEVVRRVG